MPGFTILLPPAEGKQSGGNPFAPRMFDRGANTFNYFSGLNPERRQLINALHEQIESDDDLEKLFGVKGDTLGEALEANRAVFTNPVMSALDRYSPGVMFQAMDFQNLPTGAQRRLLEHGVIFSGLFGVLRPDDLIPNYRLKMDASVSGVGRVSTYWKPHVSRVLNELVDGRFVWNLLPGAHQAAWDDAGTYRGMVDVKFFKESDGERKAVTHAVKPLRGKLVNLIVRESAESPEVLFEAEVDGFRYDEDASTWSEDSKTGTIVMAK
ncbi:MAG: peroxide stress protein YaaA [Bacteroidota bacterium]